MRFYIIVYHHSHGCDVWPVWQAQEPDLDVIADGLDDWEPDREEYLESFGPFESPKLNRQED